MSGLVEQVISYHQKVLIEKLHRYLSLKNHLQIWGPLSSIRALAKMLSFHTKRSEVSKISFL
jgi:hypothetical protein